ncbi:hypothetical protein SAMN05660649_00950 [Desulfotomaculum arcticum]|uniref:Flagellar Assembly Protein A N-terminal region domain-containing protein n=1 Tax=Desulfotruncus arcticus DSM 17038 TaxID=1121424 RepID=A0A1I2PMD8_9FIRM|nr:FapA family protein [Desulfotruncus arcticus]SFG16593.1 hypothetical protein SAMN05660649_00950 [Desulfotomaculum arcticum] [Desulfotruncus arcticus DSM 17038]
MKSEITCGTLTVTANEADNAYLNREANDLPYAFVQRGRINVRHRAEGPYPLVIPCPGVRLLVNGEERTYPTPVCMKDAVRVETINERKEGEWSVTVSPDGLQAILRTCPAIAVYRELAELPPARKLQLAVVERKEKLPVLTWDELLQELSRLGVNYNVNWEACLSSVRSCTDEEVVIAQGVPAEPGKDGRLELLFSSKSKVPVQIEETETLDFRERYVFNSVEAGEILAVKHPPTLGNPGTNVKGDVIIPVSPRDFKLVAGQGAVLTGDGEQVIAARAGRPLASRRHNLVTVSVLPGLVHNGDVNLASGNILFKGDIHITGNVEEGMTVEAEGDVKVAGLVSDANVQATGSILIKGNIISSVVVAGGTAAFQKSILPEINVLSNGLQEMTMAIRQLLSHSAFKQGDLKHGIGPLVKLLLDEKFRHLPVVTKALKNRLEILPPELAGDNLGEFVRLLERVVVQTPLGIRDLTEIETLAQRAAEWKQTFTAYLPSSSESDIVASSILNSTIIATGSVRMIGSGCYNSRIQAGKEVTISGVFRGGEVQADGDVHLGIVGSKVGTPTKVVAGPKAVVTLDYAFENTSISVGGIIYRFDREEKDIRLWLDKEGNLKSKAVPV